MKRIATFCQFAGVAVFMFALFLACNLLVHRPPGYPRSLINCSGNLENNIGIAIQLWAHEHRDQYPFNVSTNAGGTLELCARDTQGFDSNAASYFRVMSNELATPSVLVCPNDSRRKAALDFLSLQLTNISYRLRTGTNLNEHNPAEVLAICPIDGIVLHCDGNVTLLNEQKNPRLSVVESWRAYDWFRDQAEIALSLLAIAVLSFALGTRLKRTAARQEPLAL